MTGPEHYLQAEAALSTAERTYGDEGATEWSLKQAQVHATLALAAIAAEQLLGSPDRGWANVLRGS